MPNRAQVACAWVGVVSVGLILVGMLLAGYVPPPKASLTAAELADFYREDPGRTRLGILILLFGLSGFAALVAGISVVLARVEGRRPVLATLQAVAGAMGVTCLVAFGLLLAGAAFRPERAPEITQALHDIGWFMAFLAATPFIVQAVCVAAGTLGDRGAEPRLPRWFGYFNAWVAFLLLPGMLLIFVKSGPFAYHGVISFWIPLGTFAAWMLALAWAIRRDAAAP